MCIFYLGGRFGYFLFFLLGGEEGGVRGAGRGQVGFFTHKSQDRGGVSQKGGGVEGPGGCLRGKGGPNIFFGDKTPPSYISIYISWRVNRLSTLCAVSRVTTLSA